MTNKANTQERCQYEQHVEKYFGLDPEKTTDRMEIKTDFGQLCNLLCTFADKPAIPESIEQCRLTDDEFQAVNQRALLSPLPMERAIDLTQRRLLEKFAAYLGKTAKELPEDLTAENIGKKMSREFSSHGDVVDGKVVMGCLNYKASVELLSDWFSSRASEALRQKEETIERMATRMQEMAQELAEKEKQGKEFAEWASNNDWKFYKTTWSPARKDIWIKDGEQKTTDELFTLFSPAPPLGEKGKEADNE